MSCKKGTGSIPESESPLNPSFLALQPRATPENADKAQSLPIRLLWWAGL